MTEIDFTKAEAQGWVRWTKGDKDRLYFNIDKNGALDLGYYKSGNINFSELQGEKISHAEAYKLLSEKVYFDLNTGKMVADDSTEADTIKEIAENSLKEIKVEEVKPEAKEVEVEVEVAETIEGITGTTLSMDLTGKNGKDVDRLSDLFSDAVMSQADYDKLVDIWNLPASDTVEHILKGLKSAGLIEGYSMKDSL
ncbi:hypothetical protein DLJ48_06795 [Oenococcus sicerae]|uniref:Uncharacterized protein n=1 Tax=Oenococcus sicerae TaxID=2203724 RepID=A0ABX5QN84_9LACO|nr:hypothetical protein [Oenococcus sicerae]QAS70247.1 hypothetical protein DLJ48_06795 [Oenococcus sicerae]